MKKIYLIISLAILTIAFGCNINGNNQSISIIKTPKDYSFIAEYPKGKTAKVLAYIEGNLKEEKLFFKPEGIKNAELKLKDNTVFNIKAEPGYIKINFTKQQNSETSYNKLVALCFGIKEVLKD